MDDVCCAVKPEDVLPFFRHINSVHSSIQFTREREDLSRRLPFLDVLMQREEDGEGGWAEEDSIGGGGRGRGWERGEGENRRKRQERQASVRTNYRDSNERQFTVQHSMSVDREVSYVHVEFRILKGMKYIYFLA